MKLNVKVNLKRYCADPDSGCAGAAAVLMGVFFFLRAVLYFGFVNLKEASWGNLIFDLICPMLFTGGCMLCLRGFRFTLPVIYGGIAVGICVSMLLGCFEMTGVVLVLNFILILAGAFCLMVHCLGAWDLRVYSACLFGAAFLCRLIFRGLPIFSAPFSVTDWLSELSALCVYGAMVFIPLIIKKT